jgi:glycosyltransferase involved in cell wall biosynthesis
VEISGSEPLCDQSANRTRQSTIDHRSIRDPQSAVRNALMRRVLIASHTYVEPTTRGKLRALAAAGLELTVAVPRLWRDPALGRLRESSWERQQALELFPIPVSQPGDVLRARFGARALAALVRDKRPELIQIEAEPETALARQVARLASRVGIPTVLATTANVDGDRSWIDGRRRRRTLRRLQGVLAASEDAARLVRRDAPGVALQVIPPQGITAPSAPAHLEHDGLAIGFVGRLVPHRGLDTLLQALAHQRHAHWRLTIVGEGPERERLERLASDLRLAARIRWAGALPLLRELWPELDVLVVPSRPTASWNEPTGEAVAEAMAHEVPVIGSETGVLPELIGEGGLVTPPGEAGALAEALSQLFDPVVRAQLAEAARARALKLFSHEAVAERTLVFWASLLGPTTA